MRNVKFTVVYYNQMTEQKSGMDVMLEVRPIFGEMLLDFENIFLKNGGLVVPSYVRYCEQSEKSNIGAWPTYKKIFEKIQPDWVVLDFQNIAFW